MAGPSKESNLPLHLSDDSSGDEDDVFSPPYARPSKRGKAAASLDTALVRHLRLNTSPPPPSLPPASQARLSPFCAGTWR
jgi:hypothetical protein